MHTCMRPLLFHVCDSAVMEMDHQPKHITAAKPDFWVFFWRKSKLRLKMEQKLCHWIMHLDFERYGHWNWALKSYFNSFGLVMLREKCATGRIERRWHRTDKPVHRAAYWISVNAKRSRKMPILSPLNDHFNWCIYWKYGAQSNGPTDHHLCGVACGWEIHTNCAHCAAHCAIDFLFGSVAATQNVTDTIECMQKENCNIISVKKCG